MPQVAKVLAALRHRELHDLRHSFGTMAVRVPITDVQTWMGHADIATTRKYGHYAPQPGAAKRLGALIDEQLGQVVPIRPAA
jgi:integrase